MKPFDSGEKCPKCGSDSINDVWRPKVKNEFDRKSWENDGCPNAEHIERVCLRCRYKWFVAPLKVSPQRTNQEEKT